MSFCKRWCDVALAETLLLLTALPSLADDATSVADCIDSIVFTFGSGIVANLNQPGVVVARPPPIDPALKKLIEKAYCLLLLCVVLCV